MYGPRRRGRTAADSLPLPRASVLLCTRMRALTVATSLVLLAACSRAPDPAPAPGAGAAPKPPLTLEHDFGIVPHGERRVHDFVLDLGALPEPYVPMHVALDCACGHADLRIRKADGSERYCDGTARPDNLPAAGEIAILHVELDTSRREAIDLPATQSRGTITLQPLTDRTGELRIRWPFVLRFGIDSPVTLQPFAAFDFGRIARSAQHAEVITALAGDEHHRAMAFTNARADDPALAVVLEPGDGHVVLRARCRPGELGNHRAAIAVDTDLDGYRVVIPVTWKVVPDLEATPLAKISFRAVLDRPQEYAAETRQFVLVTDHDTGRSPEFAVHRIVDGDGADASACFATTLQPVPGQDRQQRLSVRYLGGLHGTFRGQIVLTKAGDDGPFLPIDLVVFPQQQP